MTPQIRGDITAERAKAEVQSLHEKIEDARVGGSLEEAAQKAKLPVMTYDETAPGTTRAELELPTFLTPRR